MRALRAETAVPRTGIGMPMPAKHPNCTLSDTENLIGVNPMNDRCKIKSAS